MKKLLLLLSVPLAVYSQWQPDVRLTTTTSNAATGTYNNGRNVAASGQFLHVVYMDFRNGNQEIYYNRSTDNGLSWSTDTRLTNNTSASLYPSVAVSGSFVHIVWADNRDGNYEIYYKRSTDGGINWETDTRLTNYPLNSLSPSIAVSGSFMHIVWYDNRDGNNEIYYKRSIDGGVSWEADTRLTNDPSSNFFPSIAVNSSTVHIALLDYRDGSNGEIYYKRSTDAGVNWGADTRLTNDIAYSSIPSISVSGQFVHVVWEDRRIDGIGDIFYKRSPDGGVNWGADTQLTNDPNRSSLPSAEASGSGVHIVWYDVRDDIYGEIYYKRSLNGGISWSDDERLTNDPDYSLNPSVALSGSNVHVVWSDRRLGHYEIYYKHNPTGNIVGVLNINSITPNHYSLSQNYPNPFNPNTTIEFSIPEAAFVKLVIYNSLGKEVESIVSKNLAPGTYELDWNASNFPSGVYFYKLSAGNFSETRKMILSK